MSGKLKYEHILESEKFKEFMSLIDQNIPIVIKHWSDDLGFKCPSSFVYFLKRKHITYKISSSFNNITDELKEQIFSDYNNNILSVEQIMLKYNLSNLVFYKLVGKRKDKDGIRRKRGNTILTRVLHDIPVDNTCFGHLRKLLDDNNIKYNIIMENNNTLIFLVNCCECGKPIKVRVADFGRLSEDPKIKCYNCFAKNHSSIKAASKSLNKLNTSGYIGVGIKKVKGKAYGYRLTIEKEKIKVVDKYFNDQTLSEKTLIEAVVYREKYIIDNNLPHTRNLTDLELISNMEMLGQHNEINKYVYDKYFV